MINLAFKNRYLDLGDGFYDPCHPTAVEDPALIKFNHDLAADLGVATQELDDQHLAEIFSGNVVHDSCDPLAMAYAGHQFGHFNPQLGDRIMGSENYLCRSSKPGEIDTGKK